MRKKILAILIIFLLPLSNYFAQEQNISTKNAVFLELGGNGLFASINYERYLNKTFGLRVGFGSLVVQGKSYVIMFNTYFGQEKKLELGAGIVLYSYLEEKTYWGNNGSGTLITTTIGHNFYKNNGGLLLRYSFTPAFNIQDKKLLLYLGVSVGFAF